MIDSEVVIDCSAWAEEEALPEKAHSAHEILFLEHGSASVRIGKNTYNAGGPSLIFSSMIEARTVQSLSPGSRGYVLHLSPRLLDACIQDMRLISVFRNRALPFSHCVPAGPYTVELAACFSLLRRERQFGGEYAELLVSSCLTQILILTLRECPDNFYIPSPKVQAEINEIQRYIENHYDQDLKISSIAEERFINHYYLTHSFKEYTGLSPKQYLLSVRLAQARRILTCTRMSVREAAAQCGFHDVNNFIRTFKSEHGMTPLQYKKQRGQKVELCAQP